MKTMPRIENVHGCVVSNEVQRAVVKWLSFVRLKVLDGYDLGEELHRKLEDLLMNSSDPTDALSQSCAQYLKQLEEKAGTPINAACLYHRPSGCLVLCAQGPHPESYMRLTLYTNRERGTGMFEMCWFCMGVSA